MPQVINPPATLPPILCPLHLIPADNGGVVDHDIDLNLLPQLFLYLRRCFAYGSDVVEVDGDEVRVGGGAAGIDGLDDGERGALFTGEEEDGGGVAVGEGEGGFGADAAGGGAGDED